MAIYRLISDTQENLLSIAALTNLKCTIIADNSLVLSSPLAISESNKS